MADLANCDIGDSRTGYSRQPRLGIERSVAEFLRAEFKVLHVPRIGRGCCVRDDVHGTEKHVSFTVDHYALIFSSQKGTRIYYCVF